MPNLNQRVVALDLKRYPFRVIPVPEKTVLCLGTFDGVHIAHTRLIREGIRVAGGTGGEPGAFCFFGTPGDYFAPRPHTHLTTLREKLILMSGAGLSFAVLCDFGNIADMSRDGFIDSLIGDLGAVGVVCGFNYRFGKGAAGDCAYLSDAAGKRGVSVSVIPETALGCDTVSASAIRRYLTLGQPLEAQRMLGRPYSIEGRVTRGRQIGRTIDFPTANLSFLPEKLIPKTGVYATRAVILPENPATPERVYNGVTNVGARPTVEDCGRINCETHILGLPEGTDLYGRRLRIEFLAYLRPEKAFAGLDELKAAIRADISTARTYFDRAYFDGKDG